MRCRAAAYSLVALTALFGGSADIRAAEILRMPGLQDGDTIVRLPGIEGGIGQPASLVGVRGSDGRVHTIGLQGGRLVVSTTALSSQTSGSRPADILDDGEVTLGQQDIARAWLTDPTDRYGHGVLGDAIEAGGLALERADGRVARYKLDAGSVFEDRRVRLIDLDRDGRDEAIVVQSYLDAGAALAVFGLDASGVAFLSEVPAIGRVNRWLNPAGAADFDGDGRIEIAFVETPHIGGTLRLYEYRDGKLHEDHAARGFSNHAIGSREQALAAVHDWTGDGVPDIAVPNARRNALRFVTFAGGRLREFDGAVHDQEIVTAVRPAILDATGNVYAVYGLEDGTVVAARPAARD